MARALKKISLLIFTWLIPLLPHATSKTIIMLDPAGDAEKKCRKLSHGYERGATLMLAETINQYLVKNQLIMPLLTRHAGETHPSLFAASFANRLNVGLFVHISIFKHDNPKPILFVYYRCTNRFTNFASHASHPLEFIPLESAHLMNIKASKQMANKFKQGLEAKNGQKLFDIHHPIGIPLTSLYGVISPSIHLEIGIDDESKLASLGIDIANALISSLIG